MKNNFFLSQNHPARPRGGITQGALISSNVSSQFDAFLFLAYLFKYYVCSMFLIHKNAQFWGLDNFEMLQWKDIKGGDNE